MHSFFTYLYTEYLIQKYKYYNERKYYFIDTGLRNARLNFAFSDEGQMLENIVYNELLFMGYELKVFNDEEKEVDFVAIKQDEKLYVQVSNDLSLQTTFDREISPLLKI